MYKESLLLEVERCQRLYLCFGMWYHTAAEALCSVGLFQVQREHMLQEEFQLWRVFPLEVMRMSCCVRKAIWNAALIEFLCKSRWMKSSALCQSISGEGRKIFFFFFSSNKVLCSKLIDKILVWLCTCFKSLPKTQISEVVSNKLKVYFCVKLF